MRKGLFIVLLLLSLLPLPLTAQRMTTMGTDFWLCFMDYQNLSSQPVVTYHRLFVSGIRNCSVTVSNPNTGWSATESVVPGQVATIVIPIEQCENTTSEAVVNKGLHVTSTDTVSVYSSRNSTANYDVANILPTASLRDDYMMMSYPADRWGCIFAIVATEDNTTVDIVLTNPTRNGASAGDTITAVLPNAGNVYQVYQTYLENNYGVTFHDFTGTRVHSLDCKPIAVFNGDVCVYVPSYYGYGQTCDHTFEQCIPTSYWGREFIVPRLATSQYPDYVRVTALRDSTWVSRNGGTPEFLNSGETYDYQISSGTGDKVTSTAPVSVNLYFASTGSVVNGDPSMLNIMPVEQMVHDVTFASYTTPNTSQHMLNVILRTSDKHLFRLDGVAYPSSSFMPIPADTSFSSAIFPVAEGSHTIHMDATGSGFIANVYGMGLRESYAYVAGSRLENLENTMFVNGHYVASGDVVNGCIGDTFTFAAHHDEEIDYTVWDIEGTLTVGDSVSKTFTSQGLTQVTAYLNQSAATCFAQDDTLRVFVNIHGMDTTEIDTTVCRMPLTWFGNEFSEPGTIEHHLQNIHGCDSLLLMNLQLNTQGSDTTLLDTIVCYNPFVWFGDSITTAGQYTHLLENIHQCDSILLLNLDFRVIEATEKEYEGCDSVVVGGVVYRTTTRVSDTLSTDEGCDSIVSVVFSIHPSYYRIDRQDLDQGDTLVWIDGGIYWSDEQHPEMFFTSQYGCDSIVRLQLNIIPHAVPPPPDSSAIWIPSAFTPDEETNALFKVESNDVIEMRVTIFTRWGLFVTEFDGLTGGWDGTYRGTKCKQETYVYLVEYRTKLMPSIVQKYIGTVMLLR